jgi:hypothetical protein
LKELLGEMREGLLIKEKALLDILAITENQHTVVESVLPLSEIRSLVFDMNAEKQSAINTVIRCDDMFEAMLKEHGQELERRQSEFTEQVGQIQVLIRRVMDLDVKIRVIEEENNKRLDARRELEIPSAAFKQKSTIPTSHKKVVQAYENSSKFKV